MACIEEMQCAAEGGGTDHLLSLNAHQDGGSPDGIDGEAVRCSREFDSLQIAEKDIAANLLSNRFDQDGRLKIHCHDGLDASVGGFDFREALEWGELAAKGARWPRGQDPDR